jgi:hypothetical protein
VPVVMRLRIRAHQPTIRRSYGAPTQLL